MTFINIERNEVRIPNLPLGKVVDENGMPTAEEQTFRQTLLSALQSLFGNEGCVVPTQSAANITVIQNNQVPAPGTTLGYTYSCAFGTMLYNSDANIIEAAINSNSSDNAPVFDQVFLFDDETVYPTAGAVAGYALTTFNGTQYKIALYAL